MCLAIPMEIEELDEFTARCSARGVERDVSLFMLMHEDLAVGDHVLVHVGYAIQKISAEDASATWELFDEVETAMNRTQEASTETAEKEHV